MEQPIIEIKNIGKRYKITHQKGGYITFRDVMMNALKAPFSFLKTKVKKITGFETKEEFWALKNITLNIGKGEVIGFIGPNGAGKSTLLKILSQITPPTEGEIKIHGRVGSLLEVGTGFHPELTGRENIFLNGAILGMTKKEVVKKFDEIIKFSGIEKFLDTPVKYYSSGMYVRLAFSVAAHMEPDILIVDEVLAVGDAEFQKKCLGKMEDITKKDGRTIIFVSHNMDAIERLCQKCAVLKNGRIDYFGETEDAINHYMSGLISNKSSMLENKDLRKYGPASFSNFKNIETLNDKDEPIAVFKIGEPLKIKFDIELFSDVSNFEIGFNINNLTNVNLSTDIGEWEGLPKELKAGNHQIVCRIENFNCFPGNYGITAWMKKINDHVDLHVERATQFTVVASDITGHNPDFRYNNMGVYQKSSWKILD
jgi:lipopolysaccharide transport system ATP-binding protein